MIGRALNLLGLTKTPEYLSRAFEADLEIKKLTEIRDHLIAQQEAIDLNARRLTDKEISRDVVDRHILDIQKQILEHMRDLDSIEPGAGFVAARKKSASTLRAEALGLDKLTPPGHHWREHEGKFILVQHDKKAEGFFVNQDILKIEQEKIRLGEPGDLKLAIRPSSEQASAGQLRARELGLKAEDLPAGHIWALDATGTLGLRRTGKGPHFWFDSEAYANASNKGDPKQFIRPIAEKADSDSESARFAAQGWHEAYRELGGDGTSTSFGKFTKVLHDLGVHEVEIVDRMKQTSKGSERDPSPEGLGVRTIRHSTKEYYADNVIMPHLANEASLKESPRYLAMVEAGKPEREALIAASQERLLKITDQLDSADKGSLGEKWHKHWYGQPGDRPQFSVSQKDIATRYPGADLKQDRNLDVLRKVNSDEADIREIKNVAGSLNEPRLKSEMDAHLLLVNKAVKVGNNLYKVRQVVWRLLDPATLKESGTRTFILKYLKEGARFEVQTPDGVKDVTSENYGKLVTDYANRTR